MNLHYCSRLHSWKRWQHHQWHVIERWRRLLFTELLECIPETANSIVQPMVGVAQHALQKPCRSQQRNDGLYPTRVPPLIGHPTKRSCRGNDACATELTPRTPDILHAFVSKPSLVTSAAIGTLQVFGREIHHTQHQTNHCRMLVGPCCREVCAPKTLSNPSTTAHTHCFPTHGGQIRLRWRLIISSSSATMAGSLSVC